jgi:CrcB protein
VPTLLVAVFGAAGAVVRYRIGLAVGVRSFPWATLAINLSGTLLLVALVTGPGHGHWSKETTTAATVGFLGAYTTFSTFGNETFQMVRDGRTGAAALYVAASVVGGLLAAWAGYGIGLQLR